MVPQGIMTPEEEVDVERYKREWAPVMYLSGLANGRLGAKEELCKMKRDIF